MSESIGQVLKSRQRTLLRQQAQMTKIRRLIEERTGVPVRVVSINKSRIILGVGSSVAASEIKFASDELIGIINTQLNFSPPLQKIQTRVV